jgi:hypothetical protein
MRHFTQRISAGILNKEGKCPRTWKTKSSGPQKPCIKKDYAVLLGRNLLKEIQADMAHLKTPLWLSLAPKHPGEASWGSYMADQWCAFCMINLTFTLIWLWGGSEKTSFKYRALENYVHLVTAIETGTTRKVTPSWIQDYEFHIYQYLSTLIELYPGTTISPYQHLALHYGMFLRRFGPSHGWWCWAFERANYKLQQIPTNTKYGMCILKWIS